MKKITNPLIYGLLLLATFAFQACKKDAPERVLEKPVRDEPGTASREDLLKDSVYLYTYFLYLWQDQLPERFPTRQYRRAEDVLEALMAYSKDPQTNQILDRYSFLDRTGTVDEEIQEGREGGFGFDVFYQTNDQLYIKLVRPNSPAAQAGIQRSWQILAINGNSNLNANVLEANNFAFIWNALDGTSIQLKLKKPDGPTVDITLQRRNFAINPVLFSKVYTKGTKEIGYFVFDSFLATTNLNGSPTSTKNQLDQIFSTFEAQNVEEVIVDLRYNGGGAVETAEYLSNMLAPASADGELMYSYETNETLKNDEDFEGFFTPVKFNKENNLRPKRLYFLVTPGTASASELLINNLKPYTEVKLIGEKTTYGKPVGFFGLDLFGNDLYVVSFKTVNSRGQSDYYQGMPVDKVMEEDLREDWGSENDPLLKEAFYYSQNNSFSNAMMLRSGLNSHSLGITPSAINRAIDSRRNKDMFDFRKKKPMGRNANTR